MQKGSSESSVPDRREARSRTPARSSGLGCGRTWRLRTRTRLLPSGCSCHRLSYFEGRPRALGQGVRRKKGGLIPLLMTAAPSFLPGIVMLVPAVEDSAHISEIISVTLKVSSALPPYEQTIFVFAGSSLEDVLKMAQDIRGFT